LSVFRLRLPATSANLGAAFDTAAVALALFLTVDAEKAEEFSIEATGRNAQQCSRMEDNLVLETYRNLLTREGRPVQPLAIRMENQIPLGMGCGSSAAGLLAATALAVHFGELNWNSDRILAEACALEGHPDNVAACWLGGLAIAACPAGVVHAARVEPPAAWRATVVMPGRSLATSKARALLPQQYTWLDTVANIQAASLLGLAFAQGRGDLLAPAMSDRIHQPYRAEACPLLPLLLPLTGSHGILGVALSGAGPSVLLILAGDEGVPGAITAIQDALAGKMDVEILTMNFESQGARDTLKKN
jgi:homoserine kinase